jgi:DNA-binding NtrC family response regulator
VTLIEACMLRRWPGNVRELIAEVGDAARQVSSRNDLGEELGVTAQHLAARAGTGFVRPALEAADSAGPATGPVRRGRACPRAPPSRKALRASAGQVATAARALGLRRNQLRRWLATHRSTHASSAATTPTPSRATRTRRASKLAPWSRSPSPPAARSLLEKTGSSKIFTPSWSTTISG